jgi:dihydrofolate reductase
MGRVRVAAYSISLDGYSAGPSQTLDAPLGVGGVELMNWIFPTRSFRTMHGGASDGETGVDNAMVEQSFVNMGAWILGRNMFGPVRGPWPDESWKGWWGEEPPYHCPVFVLTHYPRASITMKGGTVFHFVTDGIEAALERAREAAGDKDIRIGGGAATVRQYLAARLIDELHLAWRPMLMGAGERIFESLDAKALGYECQKSISGERATHVFLRKKP